MQPHLIRYCQYSLSVSSVTSHCHIPCLVLAFLMRLHAAPMVNLVTFCNQYSVDVALAATNREFIVIMIGFGIGQVPWT